MTKLLYFAYGSNLLYTRLISRVGKCEYVKQYKLYGYKLVFNTVGYDKVAYANIVSATENDYVEGVLYSLTNYQFSILDKYEALYRRVYFKLPKNKALTTICTYQAMPLYVKGGVSPTIDYIETILQGCIDFGLHKAYSDVKHQLHKVTGNTNKHSVSI